MVVFCPLRSARRFHHDDWQCCRTGHVCLSALDAQGEDGIDRMWHCNSLRASRWYRNKSYKSIFKQNSSNSRLCNQNSTTFCLFLTNYNYLCQIKATEKWHKEEALCKALDCQECEDRVLTILHIITKTTALMGWQQATMATCFINPYARGQEKQ